MENSALGTALFTFRSSSISKPGPDLQDETNAPTRRRRGKGKRRLVGRKPKTVRPSSSSQENKDSPASEGTAGSSSNVCDSESDATYTDSDSDGSDTGHKTCKKSVNEPHLCSETEFFSETTASEQTVNETDFEEQTEVRKRRKHVPQLAYRRKHASRRVVPPESESEEEGERHATKSSDSAGELSVTESSSSEEENQDEKLEENVTRSHSVDANEGQTGARSKGPASETEGSNVSKIKKSVA
ncbi:dentin sialophosphoprotein-like [Frankliniella occidentalis]|uniref:Dentin sialophosphoprotein-like n=1 Tax=Frankliniella occidentalis TaxID=133901 RepID=A0A9C6U2P7_FRAOC|nr:dentin sialophosphoprotein-like [Frankliniella occidentalis]